MDELPKLMEDNPDTATRRHANRTILCFRFVVVFAMVPIAKKRIFPAASLSCLRPSYNFAGAGGG